MKKRPNFITLLPIVVYFLGSASAGSTYWQYTSGDPDWFISANWSHGVPTHSSWAYINNGTTAVVSNDTATALQLYVGHVNSGTVNHTAGELNGNINLGNGLGSTGTYYLSGTARVSAYLKEYIGAGGTGTFIQTGGSNILHSSMGSIHIGSSATGDGTYLLSGGELLTPYHIFVGQYGTGRFSQSGGTAECNWLTIGFEPNSHGTYELSGGQLSALTERVGRNGTGTFVQSGGTHIVNILDIGKYNALPGGEYNISGGTLNVNTLNLGQIGPGTVNITNSAANINVYNNLVLYDNSTFTAVAGSTIHLKGGNLPNYSTNPAALCGLNNLNLIFEGENISAILYEVAGQDIGAVIEGFHENFALGTLTIGGADVDKVSLDDYWDNTPGDEALYVKNLIVNAGSNLDLSGQNVYYLNLVNNGGTIVLNGGSLIQVAIPGDFEPNGDVNFLDFAVLAHAWRSSSGDTNWNPDCDISEPSDNVIDERDLTVFCKYWLE